MLMRHWATIAFFAGFVLCLPGVVFASGKHKAEGHVHGQALGHVKILHAEKTAKKLVKTNQKAVKKRAEHPVAQVKHLVDHASGSLKSHGQSAIHASKKALDHASSRSAVHQSAHTVKVQLPPSSPHMKSKQIHKGQAKKSVKTIRKATHTTVKSHTVEKTITKPSTHLLKKQQSKSDISQKTRHQKHHSPLTDPYSVPATIPASVGGTSSSHTHPLQGQGSSGQHNFSNFWVLPLGNHNGKLTLGRLVSWNSQYRNQWIHAPPSPPPRMASSFSNV